MTKLDEALDELIQAAYSCGRASILQDPGPRFDEMGDKVLAASATTAELVPDRARVEALEAVARAARELVGVERWVEENGGKGASIENLQSALAALDGGDLEDAP